MQDWKLSAVKSDSWNCPKSGLITRYTVSAKAKCNHGFGHDEEFIGDVIALNSKQAKEKMLSGDVESWGPYAGDSLKLLNI